MRGSKYRSPAFGRRFQGRHAEVAGVYGAGEKSQEISAVKLNTICRAMSGSLLPRFSKIKRASTTATPPKSSRTSGISCGAAPGDRMEMPNVYAPFAAAREAISPAQPVTPGSEGSSTTNNKLVRPDLPGDLFAGLCRYHDVGLAFVESFLALVDGDEPCFRRRLFEKVDDQAAAGAAADDGRVQGCFRVHKNHCARVMNGATADIRNGIFLM